MEKAYDLVVIGAGPGGYVSAIRAAQEGLRVAVVERGDVGGTCLNRGCIPTKTLMHTAHLYRELTHAQTLGIHAEGVNLDLRRMYGRKDEVVTQLRSGVEQLLQVNRVELLRGQAVIAAPGRVIVAGEELAATNILIATGAVPAGLPVSGLEQPSVIDSDTILEQSGAVCQKLVIIGGGVIGVEFATLFSDLGSEVTIIEAMPRILPTMDREISQNLSAILKKRGVTIHTASTLIGVEKKEEDFSCKFSSKAKELDVDAQTILVAVGRRANVDGLFTEGFGVDYDRGIVVDQNFQTSIPGIYAIGDVISGGIQLAHMASAQGCNAVAHIAGKQSEIDLSVVPACIYTDPEIATAGLTEAQAKEQNIPVKTGKYIMTGNGKSIIEQQERGFIKLVFDRETEAILGAHLMCARATDLISELSTAIVNKLTAQDLASVIRPHPTFTEGVTEAVENVFSRAIHVAPKGRM